MSRATIQAPNVLLPGSILWADDATPEERRRVFECIRRNPYWHRRDESHEQPCRNKTIKTEAT
jgi:hypothetical protein